MNNCLDILVVDGDIFFCPELEHLRDDVTAGSADDIRGVDVEDAGGRQGEEATDCVAEVQEDYEQDPACTIKRAKA